MRVIEQIVPGKIQANISAITSRDGRVTVERILPAPWPAMQDIMAVRWEAAARIDVTFTKNGTASTRYLYRGISIPGLREPTVRQRYDEVGELEFPITRDSVEARAFDRRARVTQVLRSAEENIVAVTVQGEPLEDSQRDALWHAVSFLAGGRAQPVAIESMDTDGALAAVSYLNGVSAGPTDYAPFGPYEADTSISAHAFETLCDGIEMRIRDGYPIGIALHHLHDANSGYYLVDLRNTLLSIHTLFEAWADIHHLRDIVSDRIYRKYRKPLQRSAACTISNEELRCKVDEAIQFGNKRTAETFDVAFPAFMNISVSDVAYAGLKRRNELVHRGWLPHTDDEVQQLLDERRATRTLANVLIARLCGYEGKLFDYETYEYSYL